MNTAVTTVTTRRYDIDWLRIIAVLLLFPFHVARIFNVDEQFYAKSAVLSKGLTYVITYLEPWHMPLFFFLAGASTWFALSHRGGGSYAWERFKRLHQEFNATVQALGWETLLESGIDPAREFGVPAEYAHRIAIDDTGVGGGVTEPLAAIIHVGISGRAMEIGVALLAEVGIVRTVRDRLVVVDVGVVVVIATHGGAQLEHILRQIVGSNCIRQARSGRRRVVDVGAQVAIGALGVN